MTRELKKLIIIIAIVIAAVSVLYKLIPGTYNSIVEKDEEVKSQWAQVENQYQRRLDLIPNLVSTVKAYLSHESALLTSIAEARSKAGGSINIDSSALENPEAFKNYQMIQDSLTSNIQRLLMISENYPVLKANENFLELQSQLEGCENRIAVERKRYNEAAKDFNVFIRKFPNSFIAKSSGFKTKVYFEAQKDSYTAPKIVF